MPEAEPLLHTWSLAVEEQFYVFLPLLLIVTHRRFSYYKERIVFFLFIVSFGLSAVFLNSHPSGVFYLIPTRAWELLAGTMLAFRGMPVPQSRLSREAASWTGLGLILAGVFGYSVTTPFPGPAAMVPCVGAGLLLVAGITGNSLIATLLSSTPIKFIGLISYSLYLWHWPLIVFQRKYSILVSNGRDVANGSSNVTMNVLLLGTALIIAGLSWYFIERPFRKTILLFATPKIFLYSALALVGLCVLGSVTIATNGFRGRFSEEQVRLAGYLGYGQEHFRPGQCFILQPYQFKNFDKKACLPENPGKKTYLILGDSTAAGLWYGFSTLLRSSNVQQVTAAGCKPLLEQHASANVECQKLISYAFEQHLPNHRIDLVIISARWGANDPPRISRTLNWLRRHNVRVLVLGPPVEYAVPLPRLLASSRSLHYDATSGEPLPKPSFESELRRLSSAGGAQYVSQYELICNPACTTLLPSGVPVQFDNFHFTREGSVFVAQKLLENRYVE